MIDVSIVVPIYNVEPYLRAAVDSMLAQTHAQIEVILVDDGSPDGCGAICDAYAAQDARVKVIHKPHNEGTGMARNTGMDAAQGEYLFFCDPDDIMQPQLIETALRAARSQRADILVFGYTRIDPRTGAQSVRLPPVEGCFTRAQYFADYERLAFSDVLWVKLVRRAYVTQHQLRSTTLSSGQDVVLGYQLVSAPFERIAFIQQPLYTYLPRKSSVTVRYNPKKLSNWFEAERYRIRMFQQIPDEQVRHRLSTNVFLKAVEVAVNYYRDYPELSFDQMLTELRTYCDSAPYAQLRKQLRVGDYPGTKQRVKLFLLKHRLYWLYLKLIRRSA